MSTVNPPLPYKRSDAKPYARANLQGVWGAIPYPFTPDDELDEQGCGAISATTSITSCWMVSIAVTL